MGKQLFQIASATYLATAAAQNTVLGTWNVGSTSGIFLGHVSALSGTPDSNGNVVATLGLYPVEAESGEYGPGIAATAGAWSEAYDGGANQFIQSSTGLEDPTSAVVVGLRATSYKVVLHQVTAGDSVTLSASLTAND